MGRNKGLLNISSNFEVKYSEPLDSRLKVTNIVELLAPETFEPFAYLGMLVVVCEDTDEDNNGLYWLKQFPYTDLSNWTKVNGSIKQSINYSLSYANGQYLSMAGKMFQSADSGFRFHKMGVLSGVSIYSFNQINRNVYIYRNTELVYTISIGASTAYYKPDINILFSIGDTIKVFVEHIKGDLLLNVNSNLDIIF